jgi:hypothetical protein
MNIKRFILPFFTVILITVILLLNTGVYVRIHACSSCETVSLNASLLDNKVSYPDDCCGASSDTKHNSPNTSIWNHCCNISIEKYKITNFIPSDKVNLISALFLIPEYGTILPDPIFSYLQFPVVNPPGNQTGRQLIVSIHQILI